MKSTWTAALVLAAAAALAGQASAQAPVVTVGGSSCAGGNCGAGGYASVGHAAVGHAGGCATGGCDAGSAAGGCGSCANGHCGWASPCGWFAKRACGGCGGCGGCRWCKPLGDTCCPGKDGILVRMYCCLTRPKPNTAPHLKKAEYPLGFPHSPYIRSPRDYFMQDVYQPNY